MIELEKSLGACGIQYDETFSVAAIRDRRIQAECFDGVAAAEAWLTTDRRNAWNLYLCGNPVKPGTTGKPKAEDIIKGRVLLFDVDPDPDEVAARDTVLQARDWLRAGGFECYAIDSGRGAQLWIRVDPTLTNTERRRLSKWLGEKFACPGVKIDATHNPDRLMRLPGSVNQKTGRTAAFLP